MGLPRLGHLLEGSLYVSDLDRPHGFYAGVLGLEEFSREDWMCAMGVPGAAVLRLFRLALTIPRNEQEAWEAHLVAREVAVESRITWPAGDTSLYFRDTDGRSSEVASPGQWPNY